ncbi:uncharacterized protein LOC132059955 isoform X2 [Lycium ferocissimum]|nr:uncharacterized protein LOC132059955 isoform X2 [Lycium ferocissimum]
MAFPNFSTAGVVLEGVGFFSNNHKASFYGIGMMRTNCRSEDINILVQHQGSPINHVMDGPFPIDFPVENSENYNGTGTIYYGLQVTSSSHEVCALETPILGNVIADNRDEGAMKLVVADGLNGNGVILNEIECSVPTSPFAANSKINLPNPKHKLLDEMSTSEVMGPFDKLSPISKNLVEAEQLENRVMAYSEPKSKVFSTPEVLLEGKILEETEPWKGEECPAPEMLMEPIVSPPSCAYCLKVNEADLSSWMIVIPQEQKSQATSSDTGIAADSITIANEEIDLNIIEGNDEMVIQQHIPTIETRAKDMDTRKHAEVEPLVMIVDAQGALIGKDKAVGIEKESANIEIEMNTERYEPIDRGKECMTEGPEHVPGKPNVFEKASSVPDSTNCVSETTILSSGKHKLVNRELVSLLQTKPGDGDGEALPLLTPGDQFPPKTFPESTFSMALNISFTSDKVTDIENETELKNYANGSSMKIMKSVTAFPDETNDARDKNYSVEFEEQDCEEEFVLISKQPSLREIQLIVWGCRRISEVTMINYPIIHMRYQKPN